MGVVWNEVIFLCSVHFAGFLLTTGLRNQVTWRFQVVSQCIKSIKWHWVQPWLSAWGSYKHLDKLYKQLKRRAIMNVNFGNMFLLWIILCLQTVERVKEEPYCWCFSPHSSGCQPLRRQCQCRAVPSCLFSS